jgi:hypothetical protein
VTAPLNQLDWWRSSRSVPDDPPLWRDLARLLFLLAAVCLIVGNLMPWAVGLDPVGRPDAYRSTQGTAEGVMLIAFGILLLFLARDRTMWETTSRSLQLLPLLLICVGSIMWLGADFYSRMMIEDWVRGGGSGSQTSARLVVAAGLVALAVAFGWLEWRRPARVKARTPSLIVEWGVTRWSATAVAVCLVLGVLGAVIGVVLPALFLGAEVMALAVFLAVFGLFIGIGLGLLLVRRLESAVRRRGAASVPPKSSPEPASRHTR